MKKKIICTPHDSESLLEIIIRLLTGRKKRKSLLDWVKDNSYN